MEDKNKNILNKAIELLPQFRADARIWEKIEEQLESEISERKIEVLKKAIDQLPSFKADNKTWDEIEKELDNKFKPANNFYFLKIAASLIVVIGMSILINNIFIKNSQKEFISFSQETVSDNKTDIASLELEKELDNFIQKQCQVQPDVCKRPEVADLTAQLSDLSKSLDELKIMMENSADDPETYKYMLRIQKERAGISKKLLQYFNG